MESVSGSLQEWWLVFLKRDKTAQDNNEPYKNKKTEG